MKINPRLSRFLRVASFVAACCVVMIHANTIHAVANPSAWNVKLHALFCRTLTSWAVPYFFACSGFFFALSAYAGGNGGYGRLVQKKIRGLLVPYLLWAIIATALSLPVIMLNNRLTGNPLCARTVLSASGVWDFVNQFFGIFRDSPRHLGVLWFVRALFVLFLFAPVWRLLVSRKVAWLLPVLWFCLWRYGFDINACGFQLPVRVPAFFFLGMAFAVYLPRSVLLSEAGIEAHPCPWFVGQSFWIYCTHNIILGYILPAGHFLLGKTDAAVAILTLVSIPLTILTSLLLARFSNRLCPHFYALLSGGRG